MSIVGNIIYGSWKDGSAVFKDSKGYYIVQYDMRTCKEYKKYIRNWKFFDNILHKVNNKWVSK